MYFYIYKPDSYYILQYIELLSPVLNAYTGESSQQGNSDAASVNNLSPENVAQLLGLLPKMNQKHQGDSSFNMISSGMTKCLKTHASLLKIELMPVYLKLISVLGY